MCAYKMQGAMIRSRASWIEYGEKMSKRFFILEKSHAKRKTIQKLHIDDKCKNLEVATTNQTILKCVERFYTELFSEKQIDENSNFLEGLQIPEVRPEDQVL